MYKSLKQERYFNANPGKVGGQAVVDEFNQASKGVKLPLRAKTKKPAFKMAELGGKPKRR